MAFNKVIRFFKRVTRLLILSVLIGFFCLGFRMIPYGNTWNLDKNATPTSKIFVVYPNPSRAIENNLPSNEPLANTATVTVQNLMTSIMNDFNDIQASFLVLADSSDGDYSATIAESRTITVEDSNPNGPTSAAEARQIYSSGRVSGCSIKLREMVYSSATRFVATVTHELGHCLGLDHPQEITHAIMSYFRSADYIRLQTDDRMGITFLYPITESKANEKMTYGMSCSRKE